MATTAEPKESSSSSQREFKRIEPEEYFRQHIYQGLRPDGRSSLLGFRPVSMSVGTITGADGSAVVKQGNTVVTCGVTLEMARPKEEEPDKGFIVPNLELPPLCHPRFKPGPPSEQAQVASQFLLEVINNSSLLDRRSLCIRPGRLAWVVCIDLVCHNYDGSVIDVAVKAMVAGLRTVQVPTVVLEDDDEEVMDTSEESTQTMAEEGGDIDSLKKRLKVFSKRRTRLALGPQPVSCTVAIFEGRSLLLDPTDEEEALCSALITVVLAQNHDAATEEGEEESVVHFRKAGGSPVSQNFMAECMALAKKQAKKIRKILEKAAPLEGM